MVASRHRSNTDPFCSLRSAVVAGELKDVPEEFQKGLKEGEINVKAMKSKEMEKVDAQDAEKIENE